MTWFAYQAEPVRAFQVTPDMLHAPLEGTVVGLFEKQLLWHGLTAREGDWIVHTFTGAELVLADGIFRRLFVPQAPANRDVRR